MFTKQRILLFKSGWQAKELLLCFRGNSAKLNYLQKKSLFFFGGIFLASVKIAAKG